MPFLPCGTSWSDNSEQVILQNCKAQGLFGGTGTVPSIKLMLYHLLKTQGFNKAEKPITQQEGDRACPSLDPPLRPG